jgi:methylmalonyl-CoA/ethylmalonyl-CoA epimerase
VTVRQTATRIDHVGVVVRDLEVAISYFTQRFGMVVVAREEIAGAGAQVAYLAAGTDSQTVQFLQPDRPGPLRDFLDRRGPGAHHICFEVPGLEEFVTGALDEPEQNPNIIRGGRGKRTCFLRDSTFGFVIELCEPPEEGNDG